MVESIADRWISQPQAGLQKPCLKKKLAGYGGANM